MRRDYVQQENARKDHEHAKTTECQSVICRNSDVYDQQIITSEAEMYIISSMAGRSLGNGN